MSGTTGGFPLTIPLPTTKKYQQLFPGYQPTTTDYGPGGGFDVTAGSYIDPSGLPGDVYTITPPGSPGGSATPAATTGPGAPAATQTDLERLRQGLPPRDASGNPTDPVVPQQPAGSGSSSSGSSSSKPKLNWIEEIGIRLAMVIIGIVLIGVGIHVAGQRGSAKGLVR